MAGRDAGKVDTGRGSDDDGYMGDLSLFLPPDVSSSHTNLGKKKQPPPPATSSSKAKRAKGVTWQERRRLERERKQREEDERTMAGLAEAIPESNVGFRLLKQMGYKPGSGIGSGLSEPVGVEIRRSRAGIGTAAPQAPEVAAAAARRKAEERERRRQEEMAAEFGSRQRTQWRSRRVAADYRKAEAALAQLENREVEPTPPEVEEEEKKEEEEEEIITEEDLRNILAKLRDEHHYCLYCGCKYEAAEALANECPGPSEDDH